MTRAELQRHLGWHRESIGVGIDQLEKAFRVMGQDVEVHAIEAAA